MPVSIALQQLRFRVGACRVLLKLYAGDNGSIGCLGFFALQLFGNEAGVDKCWSTLLGERSGSKFRVLVNGEGLRSSGFQFRV